MTPGVFSIRVGGSKVGAMTKSPEVSGERNEMCPTEKAEPLNLSRLMVLVGMGKLLER